MDKIGLGLPRADVARQAQCSTLPLTGPARPRKKVVLGPAHSPLAWARKCSGGSLVKALPGMGGSVSKEELAKHNSVDDAWVCINGKVYDMTPYLKFHPGGVEELMRVAGRDGTEQFREIHAWVNVDALLSKCFVGTMRPAPSKGLSSAAPKASTCLSDTVWLTCPLKDRKQVSAMSHMFSFALPEGKVTGLQPGQHIEVRGKYADGRPIIRSLTPISKPDKPSQLDLLVKLYPDGALSTYLSGLKPGGTVDIRGPFGEFGYRRGVARWSKRARRASTLCLIAGGSGVTPMLQLVQAIVEDKGDPSEVYLVWFNKSPQNIPLKEAIRKLAGLKPSVHVSFVVSNPGLKETAPSSVGDGKECDGEERASGGGGGGGGGDGVAEVSAKPSSGLRPLNSTEKDTFVGRVNKESLSELLPGPTAETVVAVCGPPGFNKAVDDTLRGLYYVAESVFTF